MSSKLLTIVAALLAGASRGWYAGIAMLMLASVSVTAHQRYARVAEHILAAWKTGDVVCLSEDQDRYYNNQLRIALVRHTGFSRTVRVVLVEMANPVHQHLLDRFILDGVTMSPRRGCGGLPRGDRSRGMGKSDLRRAAARDS